MGRCGVVFLLLLAVGCSAGRIELPTREVEGSASARRRIIASAARRGDPKCVPTMSLFLDETIEPVPLVRSTAAAGLRMIGDRRAVPALLAAASDPDPMVRADVMRALGDLGGPAEAPAVARALDADLDGRVRMEAARALGRIGGRSVLPSLVASLDDLDPAVAFAVHASLVRLTGQDLPPGRGAWETWLAAQETSDG